MDNFISKQFIRVIQWNESEDGVLAYRYPMEDMEIENGGQLTVRETQMAAFINEGKIADVFGPGLHTLNDAQPADPDRPDELEQGFRVAIQVGRVFLLDAAADGPEMGHGDAGDDSRQGVWRGARCGRMATYAYRIADPRVFFTKVSGTREVYYVADLEDAAAGDDRGADGGRVCREQRFVPGYGAEPGGAGRRRLPTR